MCTYHFLKKKIIIIELWQWDYRNTIAENVKKKKREKKRRESNCGNGIAEIGGDFSPPISAIPLPQFYSLFFFFFLAIGTHNLWKRKKKNCHVHNIFTTF